MLIRSAIGMMSGTSCDGLDLLHVRFVRENSLWSYKVLATQEVPYSESFRKELLTLHKLPSPELLQKDIEVGAFFAKSCASFIESNRIKTDHISSHGHTVFHQPELGYTLQIGSPFLISKACALPVYADFRSQDIALGGQGAPLVAIGDALLFQEYEACINLGGFANISYEQDSRRLAFDICAVNLMLNELSQRLKMPYDANGKIARSGEVQPELLKALNSLSYFKKKGPKSLDREWLEASVIPLLKEGETKDLMRTCLEHIAEQIADTIRELGLKKILFSGGGCYNSFLIERIAQRANIEIDLPSKELISFKEALIFAFLGVLKSFGEVNVLSSVTGAHYDHSAGQLFDA